VDADPRSFDVVRDGVAMSNVDTMKVGSRER
jgi:hypothetical protein